MPQSQWDRPIGAERLLIGAVVVIGARIAATFLDPGWTKHALEMLFTVTVGVILSVLLHGGAFTARRVVVIPILAVVGATIFEIGERWGWLIGGPLVVLTLVLIYKAARAGMLGPIGKVEAPPVHPTESSR